jgi:hypothetical protein
VLDRTRLKRVLLSLADPVLRRDWLAHALEHLPSAEAAEALDALLMENEAAEPGAREAAFALAAVFVVPECADLVRRLRDAAEAQGRLSLSRMLRTGPVPSTRAPAAEDAPVPDYGAGRELTLGERRSLARRPTRRSFERLLCDPHPLVIRLLLENPRLTEDDVVRMAARRPARHEVTAEIARAPRWLSRERVRMTLILNPGTPPSIAIPLVCLCTRNQLSEVIGGVDASLVLRATARELLDRRPPVPEDPAEILRVH